MLKEYTSPTITVHSSLFAVPIYQKLGFVQIDDVKEDGGIRYMPMKYKMVIREGCQCLKIKCKRHGHCNECRAHHENSKRPCRCE